MMLVSGGNGGSAPIIELDLEALPPSAARTELGRVITVAIKANREARGPDARVATHIACDRAGARHAMNAFKSSDAVGQGSRHLG